MYATHSDLSETARGNTTALLQARLRDAVDLSGQVKQAYWSMMGARLAERRELLEALHDDIDAYIDVLTRRLAALSGVAERTFGPLQSKVRLVNIRCRRTPESSIRGPSVICWHALASRCAAISIKRPRWGT